MNKEEYEKAKVECWLDTANYCGFSTTDSIKRSVFNSAFDRAYALGKQEKDTEGEEMLTVSRKRVQGIYRDNCVEIHRECVSSSDKDCYEYANEVLKTLFGYKCLPDNVDSTQPKPAEPKFHKGDTASYVCSPTLKHKCTVTKVMQNEHSDKWEYNVMFEWGKPGMWIPESDLEPYTEPEANVNHRQFIVNCDKQFDNILKDSLHNERRLNVAVQILSGIVASDKPYRHPVKRALELTDALLAECEKEK